MLEEALSETHLSSSLLQTEKIKPADRVTFLLNYLYMTLRSNQLLPNSKELELLKEVFLTCLGSYVQIMADWVSRGELIDRYQEFFIKPNPKVFTTDKNNV